MPLARFSGGVASVTMAVLSPMLPLLIPPTTRATTKMVKLWETAQMAYEAAMPICETETSRSRSEQVNEIGSVRRKRSR